MLITHNQELAMETDRFVTMRDGRLYVGDTGEEVRYGAQREHPAGAGGPAGQ